MLDLRGLKVAIGGHDDLPLCKVGLIQSMPQTPFCDYLLYFSEIEVHLNVRWAGLLDC